ncbi:MAG: tRNA (guanosine(46)-N7)-methyltransferase TrmB [Chitinophagaceae bacterium]|nr:tRNA (guanosine(46)-N7)-methyltransferase TrmB [Chitinophagaceae bacterium]
MKAKKLYRFAEISKFPHVFEFPEQMADRWGQHFGNSNDLVLELACGKGEYSVNMAKAFPEKNFIGVDIIGNRLFVGAKIALDVQIPNVAFLRTRIENITTYFHPAQVAEIWITFPDPFLRDGKAKNRLTHHKFLKMYQQILKPGGLVHLKTDSAELFQFTKEMVAHHGCEIVQLNNDVYAQGTPAFPLNIQTFYESMHLADQRTIQYISFKLPHEEIIVPAKKKKDAQPLI